MEFVVRSNVFFFIIIIWIYVFSWFLQQSLVLNSDVSWLLLAAKRLMAGGNYTLDYFEINPPIIFYLYLPVVGYKAILGLSTKVALRLYVFLLASLSLLLTSLVMKKRVTDDKQRLLFLTALSALWLLFPMSEFGQREHLYFILSVPYFLLAAARLQKTSVNKLLAIVTGVAAGWACMIKPYFLLSWIMLEIFIFLQQKKILRPELVASLLTMLFCAAIILLRHSDYLTVVIPHVHHFYYQKYSQDKWQVLTANESIFAYFSLLFYILRRHAVEQKNFYDILALMVLGFFGVFVLQRTLWFYHALPMLCASSLLMVALFSQLLTQPTFSRAEAGKLIVFFCLLSGWLVTRLSYMDLSLMHFPAGYFILFGAVFFIVVVMLLQGRRGLTAIGVALLSGMALRAYLQHSPLQVHVFLLTSALSCLLFWVFFPDKTARGKCRLATFTLLGLTLFAYPFYLPAVNYHTGVAYKKLYDNLLVFLARYPHQAQYFFSNIAEFSFPALDETQGIYASRFGCTGFLPALTYWDTDAVYQQTYAGNKAEMDFYIQAVVADFVRHQPKMIFIDARNTNKDRKKTYFGNSQLDYLRFLTLNDDFKKTWRQYRYVGTVDGQPLFKFRVYEREPSV
jgi:hypothetical protein